MLPAANIFDFSEIYNTLIFSISISSVIKKRCTKNIWNKSGPKIDPCVTIKAVPPFTLAKVGFCSLFPI